MYLSVHYFILIHSILHVVNGVTIMLMINVQDIKKHSKMCLVGMAAHITSTKSTQTSVNDIT